MIERLRTHVGATFGFMICLMSSPAWSQPATGTEQPPARATESAPVTPASGLLPVAAYPLELLGLLAPPAKRGPLTLTPSITVSEEYNDNLFQDNLRRQSDFITSFGPALTLLVNQPSYELSAGYSFAADIYATESRLNNALDRQNFVASGTYRASPGLTLTASDAFALDRSTSVVAVQGSSTGRQESWSNTFTPGLTWQMTARNSLSLSATYSVLRFLGGRTGGTEGAGAAGVDSDTYGFRSGLGHAFTPRLTGTVGYSFTYLNLTQGQEDSRTHNPTLGLTYRITPTLTGRVDGGPSVTEIGKDTFITPGGAASLTQAFQFGTAGVQYARGVSVAGGFGGTNETQTASATLAVTTLRPGLVVVFSPAYTESASVASRQNEQVDVKTIALNLGVTYLIARYTTLFAGYTFLHQRTGGSSATQVDVDQNRVRFGLQFGYPINFD